MIFPQYVIYVLIYDHLKFRKDLSITSQEIANYISVVLAVALSVDQKECITKNTIVMAALIWGFMRRNSLAIKQTEGNRYLVHLRISTRW